jgi:3-phenylpropionate/trans-cinnamate dioxygenase ferredoxin reductase subunit
VQPRYDVLIVGAGHAGAHAAIALRQKMYPGSIAIIGEESELPYERPALSKEYLAGKKPFARMLIRPEAFWLERQIALLLGHSVVAVDPERHAVMLADGSSVGYGVLIWATGGKPRRLTCRGHDLVGMHTMRSRADLDAMRAELNNVRHVVIVGGGYIGLEAAATLTQLGKQVTILEAQDRVLARVAAVPLSRFYEAEHRSHGVAIELNVVVECILGLNGRVSGVRLAGGIDLPTTMVLVGIGIMCEVQPLLAVGAAGSNGVDVDSVCRTSLSDVFAIGDCAAHENPFANGARVRLESVQNAVDQALVVAKALTGHVEPYRAVPWFWSNQFDLRLQTVGLCTGYDSVTVRGDPASRSFSVAYGRAGKLIALDCVNATKEFLRARSLLGSSPLPPLELMDEVSAVN